MRSFQNVSLTVVLMLSLCACGGGGGGGRSDEPSMDQSALAAEESEAAIANEESSSSSSAQAEPVTEPSADVIETVEPDLPTPPAADPAGAPATADEPAAEQAAGQANNAPSVPPMLAYDPAQRKNDVVLAVKTSMQIINSISPDLLTRNENPNARSISRTIDLEEAVSLSCNQGGDIAFGGSASIERDGDNRLFSFQFSATLAECNGVTGSLSADASGIAQSGMIDQSVTVNAELATSLCAVTFADLQEEATISLAQGSVGGTISGAASADCGAVLVNCSWQSVDFADSAALKAGCHTTQP